MSAPVDCTTASYNWFLRSVNIFHHAIFPSIFVHILSIFSITILSAPMECTTASHNWFLRSVNIFHHAIPRSHDLKFRNQYHKFSRCGKCSLLEVLSLECFSHNDCVEHIQYLGCGILSVDFASPLTTCRDLRLKMSQ